MDFFKFLGKSAVDFASGVGNVFKTTGDVGFNFLKNVTTPAPQQFIQNEINSKVQDLENNPVLQQKLQSNPDLQAQFNQLKQPVQTPADIAVNTVVGAAQAIPRFVKSAGLSLRGQQSYIPAPGLEQAIYGNEPVKNLTGSGRDTASTIGSILTLGQNNTAGQNINPLEATGLGIAGGLLNFINPLKGGLEKSVTDQLAKDATESAVKNTLAGKLPQEVIDKVAPSIALTKDTNVIGNIIDREVSKIPPTQVITRAPSESPDLADLVTRGKISNQTEMVPINSLKLGSDTAGTFDKSTIKGYVNDIKNQKTIDPLVVSEKDGQTFVQDGKHRLIAMKQAGVQEVPVVRQVPKNEQPSTLPVNGAALQASLAADVNKAPTVINDIRPKVEPSVTPPSQPIQDSAQTVIDSLREVRTLQAKQGALYTAERGKRFAAAQGAGQGLEGTAGFKAEVGQLKGKLPTVEWKGIVDKVGPDQAEKLYSDLRSQMRAKPGLTYTDKLNIDVALRKLILGEGLPTKSEIGRLQSVFGKDFAAAAEQSTAGFRQKARSLVTEIAGAPRALLSTGDFSGGLRQALGYATRHPINFAKAWMKQFKYFGEGLAKSDKAFQAGLREIQSHPDFPLLQKSKLAIVDISGNNISKREEQFVGSRLLEKVPWLGRIVKGSDQAYSGLLNNIRANEFYSQLDRARAANVPLTDKLVKDLGTVINTMTGRGSLGKLDKHMGALSSALFAPRLMASRIQTLNPIYYIKLDPFARKEAVTGLLALGGVVTGILGLAKLSGLQVVTDPTNADFAKIKVGDTRFDIAGGYQQYIKLAAQLAEGKITSSVSGHEVTLGKGIAQSRLDVIYHFLEGKENPLLSFASSVIRGKDAVGNPVVSGSDIANQAVQRMIPLFAQDIADVLSHPNAAPVAVTAPLSLFGVGTQTYGTQDIQLTDKQKATIQQLQNKGASQEYIDATKSFYQTQKSGPDRVQASANIDQALAAGDQAKAVQIAKDYNSQYASTFSDWNKRYGTYANDKTLVKEYSSGRIKLTADSIRQRIKSIKNNPLYNGSGQ